MVEATLTPAEWMPERRSSSGVSAAAHGRTLADRLRSAPLRLVASRLPVAANDATAADESAPGHHHPAPGTSRDGAVAAPSGRIGTWPWLVAALVGIRRRAGERAARRAMTRRLESLDPKTRRDLGLTGPCEVVALRLSAQRDPRG